MKALAKIHKIDRIVICIYQKIEDRKIPKESTDNVAILELYSAICNFPAFRLYRILQTVMFKYKKY